MKIAKVIVDLPLMQTDKPFSYAISKEFQSLIELGMRVHVPFGTGNRLVQGIIVGIEEEKDPGDGAGYYKGGSYYVLDAEGCLEMVNNYFNPYQRELALDDMHILVP